VLNCTQTRNILRGRETFQLSHIIISQLLTRAWRANGRPAFSPGVVKHPNPYYENDVTSRGVYDVEGGGRGYVIRRIEELEKESETLIT